MREIAGACHCGGITFEFCFPEQGPDSGSDSGSGGGAAIVVRECGCGFCRTHGGVWTSHPDGTLIGVLHAPEQVNRYRFGHGTADFYICNRCGAVPFVVSTVDGRDRAVVNANTFTNVARDQMMFVSTDFEAEGVDERLMRRNRNWIGRVDIRR